MSLVRGWPCVALTLAVLVSSVSAADGGAAGSGTPVLLAEGPAEVFAVALSSHYVAWRTCNAIQVRDVSGRRYPPIRLSGSGESRCQVVTSPDGSPSGIGVIDRDLLALFDGAVTWSEFSEGNSTDYLRFGQARIGIGGRMADALPSLWLSGQGPFAGRYLVGPVSDDTSLFYAETRLENDSSCSSEQLMNFECRVAFTGTVWRIDSASRRHRVAAIAATLLATSGNMLALVPAVSGQTVLSSRRRLRSPQPRVLLLRPGDGAVLRTLNTFGKPYELALSTRLGAVLTRGPWSGARLEWFDPNGGAGIRRLKVAENANALSVTGDRIIFREGTRIVSYVPGSGPPGLLAKVEPGLTNIVGPVVSGSHLVWGASDGTVRMLTLPRA